MNNNIDKYYLVYETCMKLKEVGFDMWCDKIYTPYPHYKGEPLGCDEEYELRSEGKGRGIRYKVITQDMTNKNSNQYNDKSCSCPEINTVVDWILENWKLHIIVNPYYSLDGIHWMSEIYYIKDDAIQMVNISTSSNHKYKAYANSIRWCIDNYNTL